MLLVLPTPSTTHLRRPWCSTGAGGNSFAVVLLGSSQSSPEVRSDCVPDSSPRSTPAQGMTWGTQQSLKQHLMAKPLPLNTWNWIFMPHQAVL